MACTRSDGWIVYLVSQMSQFKLKLAITHKIDVFLNSGNLTEVSFSMCILYTDHKYTHLLILMSIVFLIFLKIYDPLPTKS